MGSITHVLADCFVSYKFHTAHMFRLNVSSQGFQIAGRMLKESRIYDEDIEYGHSATNTIRLLLQQYFFVDKVMHA